MKNYNPPPLTADRGEGAYLFDADGRKYLDFSSGIAVNAVGHVHPDWVRAVSEQAAKIAHCSNLFGIPGQERLAGRLIGKAGPGRVFFCNSGAEANEALIKLARLYGKKLSNGEEGKRFHVVTAENGFHGRTFGGMAATPQEKIQGGFRPMLEGFPTAKLNDIDSFAAAIDDHTAAVLVESIQGEGGVFPADPGFLVQLRELCTARGVLLMVDEVQCGIARSGHFFAYQESGIQPDAIGMAKGLGGGFPIGAVWVADAHSDLFTPGSHGTTFGGSPLACAAANATLDIIERENLIGQVNDQAGPWHKALEKLVGKYPGHLAGLRGRGYMVALVVKSDLPAAVAAARENGLLCVPAGNSALRLLPPLTASESELNSCVSILDQTFSGLPLA